MGRNIPYAIAIGIGATLLMDVWNLFLKRSFSIPSLNLCLLGRWLRHMPGTFRHASIAAAPQKRFECAVGWNGPYTIGVALAFMLVVLLIRGVALGLGDPIDSSAHPG